MASCQTALPIPQPWGASTHQPLFLSWASSQLPSPLFPLPQPIHLPGEVVEDVAPMGVEDGDGLSEVVSLWGEE